MGWKHRPAQANGQLAVGCYLHDRDLDGYVPWVIDVLTVTGDKISAVTGFLLAQGRGLGSRPVGRQARSFSAVSACLPTRRNALRHRPYWPVGHRHEHRPDIGD